MPTMTDDRRSTADQNAQVIREAQTRLQESLGSALNDNHATEVRLRVPINQGRLSKARVSIERV